MAKRCWTAANIPVARLCYMFKKSLPPGNRLALVVRWTFVESKTWTIHWRTIASLQDQIAYILSLGPNLFSNPKAWKFLRKHLNVLNEHLNWPRHHSLRLFSASTAMVPRRLRRSSLVAVGMRGCRLNTMFKIRSIHRISWKQIWSPGCLDLGLDR